MDGYRNIGRTKKKTLASQPTNGSTSLLANKIAGRRFSPATLPFDNRPEVSTRRMRSEVRILLMSNLATSVRLRHLQFHIYKGIHSISNHDK